MSGGQTREVLSEPQKPEVDECYRDEGHAWVGEDSIELCIYCGLERTL